MRVPATTGFPIITLGSETINGSVMSPLLCGLYQTAPAQKVCRVPGRRACEPDWRLSTQPSLSKAASTRRARERLPHSDLNGLRRQLDWSAFRAGAGHPGRGPR
jgi:hypothetical protein